MASLPTGEGPLWYVGLRGFREVGCPSSPGRCSVNQMGRPVDVKPVMHRGLSTTRPKPKSGVTKASRRCGPPGSARIVGCTDEPRLRRRRDAPYLSPSTSVPVPVRRGSCGPHRCGKGMDMVQLGVVTIVGYVGSEPAIFDKAKGAICSFRLGCTRGYYDAAHVWRSFPTTWITVKTFRRLAEHVHRSVRKGDPVIVTGQLNTEVWTQEDAERSRLVIEASSVGHDLNCGNAMFYKDDKTARGVQHDADSGGRTAESGAMSDLWRRLRMRRRLRSRSMRPDTGAPMRRHLRPRRNHTVRRGARTAPSMRRRMCGNRIRIRQEPANSLPMTNRRSLPTPDSDG